MRSMALPTRRVAFSLPPNRSQTDMWETGRQSRELGRSDLPPTCDLATDLLPLGCTLYSGPPAFQMATAQPPPDSRGSATGAPSPCGLRSRVSLVPKAELA
jgi:hypothetical protein